MQRYLVTAALILGLTVSVSAHQLTDSQKAAIKQAIAASQQAIDTLKALVVEPVPDEPPPPDPPTAITVTDAASLKDALLKGGEIIAMPGRYVGNFTIGVKGTTLRTLASTQGRVHPSDVDAVTIAPEDLKAPPLVITASNVTVTGLAVTNGATDRDTVIIGSQETSDLSTQPDNVTLDSVAIVAGENGGHRGVAAHGSNITIIRCYIANWWEDGRDSQAVWGNNGPGPYLIEDNYLEASGENILFGGAFIAIPNLVPEHITIRNNDIVKPQAWKVISRGDVKNSVEFKNGRHVLIEGNRIDGNWKDGQAGHTIVLTPRNPSGNNPWVIVDDVTIRRNVVVNAKDGYAVNIMGHDSNAPSQQTRTITIDGNLFQDAPAGVQVQRGVIERLTITNNTMPAVTGNVLYFVGLNADGTPLGGFTPLTFDRNVFAAGAYGAFGAKTAPGTATLAWWSNGDYTATGNVIEKSKYRRIAWPAGNTEVEYGSLAGLLDATYHLISGVAGW